MPGYKHPCKFCGKLVSFDDNVCPFCGGSIQWGLNGALNENLIETGQVKCSNCGLMLQINCLIAANPPSLAIIVKTVTNE